MDPPGSGQSSQLRAVHPLWQVEQPLCINSRCPLISSCELAVRSPFMKRSQRDGVTNFLSKAPMAKAMLSKVTGSGESGKAAPKAER